MLLPQGKAVIFTVFSSSMPPGHLLPSGKGPQPDPCTARSSTNLPSQAGNAAGGTKTPELGNYRSNLTPVKAEEYLEWVSPEEYGLNSASLCCSLAGLNSPHAVNLYFTCWSKPWTWRGVWKCRARCYMKHKGCLLPSVLQVPLGEGRMHVQCWKMALSKNTSATNPASLP